jgi:membrane-bound lytic murein transglycosylase D
LLKRVGFSFFFALVRPAVMAALKTAPFPVAPKTVCNSQSVLCSTDVTALMTAPSEVELPLLDVNFCGEDMPLDQEVVVSRWKHVFVLFRSNSKQIDCLRQRADSFFPIVDEILEKYDIPPDFRYVPLAESGLERKAVSPKGAGGYWQLMPATARELGLRVGGKNDERFHVRKATEAACRYLRKLYDQLGSWSLVAAAYNVGPGYIKGQLKRQPNLDYYKMKLPRETRYYLYRVLLYKEMFSRPDDYSSFLSPAPLTTFRLKPNLFDQTAA